MVERDDAELVSYLAKHSGSARLVLRASSDTDAALAALRRAGEALWEIPHPEKPENGLPSWCEASLLDGNPVLKLDVQNRSEYAEPITMAIVTTLEIAEVTGHLEPLPWTDSESD